MGNLSKRKKGSNDVNINIGHVEDSTLHAVNGTATYGGLHFDLSGDADNSAEDASSDETSQPNATSLALFRALSTKFTLEELETVCWELGIAFEDLPAKTLSGKARQLVQKADDLSVTAKLIAIIQRDRPDAGINSLEAS